MLSLVDLEDHQPLTCHGDQKVSCLKIKTKLWVKDAYSTIEGLTTGGVIFKEYSEKFKEKNAQSGKHTLL
jgi:hypothetical protein